MPTLQLERVTEFTTPRSDAEFLYNVGIVANSIDVEFKDRDQAFAYLLAVAAKDLPAEYYALEQDVVDLGRSYGIDDGRLVSATLFLLSRLARFDYDLANEGREVAELSLAFADRLDEITEATSDHNVIWSGALGHDSGKSALDPELNEKSKRGESWDEHDVEAMKPHSLWSFIMALAAGQPQKIARIKYANHAKQFGAQYGDDITLGTDERRERDVVAAADGLLACMTRTNSRNRYMPEAERWALVLESLLHRFNDYNHCSERNNPYSIPRELLAVGKEYVSPRYEFEEQPGGLVVVRQIGSKALSLAAA